MFDFMSLKDQQTFNDVSDNLSKFFRSKNFIEVHMQSNLTILAACEDPTTIEKFSFDDKEFPLPQTNQMNLEHFLLKNPDIPGVFCQSTSYRNEDNPIEGRHSKIFPMFEFEAKGTMKDLYDLEIELLDFLGFDKFKNDLSFFDKHFNYHGGTYDYTASELGVDELTANEETIINNTISPVYFLQDFPEKTHPFWNMKRSEFGANKIDVILFGQETIGSAEREVDPVIMKDRFFKISDGKYAELLFAHFGRDRVLNELDAFLKLPMFPRFGGGIGMTRMIRAMNMLKIEN